MATALEHGDIVLSAILPNRRDLLDKAVMSLSGKNFADPLQATFFKLIQRYSEVSNGSVLPKKYLDDLLREKDSSKTPVFLEKYDTYATTEVSDSDFYWSVKQLKEISADKATGNLITEAMEALKHGVDDGHGNLVKGHAVAREVLLRGFQEIDLEIAKQEAPEGDIREERIDILSDYADRKRAREQGKTPGIYFGITDLDAKIGGLQNGELILLAAYSSTGKSTLAVQLAWSAAVEQGKNVLYLTTETPRLQTRRKLVARHSKMPIFEIPEGLNTRDLKAGTLSEADEEKLQIVVKDLESNPAYGKIYMAQVPRGATLSTIEQLIYRVNRQFQVDIVIDDYLALHSSDRRRNTTREELSDLLKGAKLLATTFDNGRGIPFVSPWQINRSSYSKTEETGSYTSAALAETSEATSSTDIIVSLLAPPDAPESRYVDLKLQVLKNRDGERSSSLITSVDYATSYFESKSEESVFTGSADSDILSALL